MRGSPAGQIARQRIAALDDEIGNDAVELHAVVEAAVGELLEVLDRLRRFLLVQLGDDGPFVGLERGGFWHGGNLGRAVGGAVVSRPRGQPALDSICRWCIGCTGLRLHGLREHNGVPARLGDSDFVHSVKRSTARQHDRHVRSHAPARAPARVSCLRLARADARSAERPRNDGRRRDRPPADPRLG